MQALWNSVEDWVLNKTGTVENFDKITIMFGIINNKYRIIINWLKLFMYSEMQRHKLAIASVENTLKKIH